MSSIFKGLVTEKKKKPKPTSPEKWASAKAKARSKFDVYPSAYANAWAAKEYKKMGGGWRMGESIVDLDENLLKTYADMFDYDENVSEAQGDTLLDPEYALPEARKITKAIKYDDTVGEIITQLQMLAERTEGVDSKTLEYSIDGVLAAKNALESAVYDLEEAFEDAVRNQQYKRDEEELNEMPDTSGPVGTQEGGWRTYKSKPAGEIEEDTAYAGGMGQGGNAGQSYRKFKPKSAGTFNEEQLDEKCWDTHKQVGMKKKGDRMVPNCVPKESAIMKGLKK